MTHRRYMLGKVGQPDFPEMIERVRRVSHRVSPRCCVSTLPHASEDLLNGSQEPKWPGRRRKSMGRTSIACLLTAVLTVSCAPGADRSPVSATTLAPPPPGSSVPASPSPTPSSPPSLAPSSPPSLLAIEEAQRTWREVRKPDYVFIVNRGCAECDQTLVGSFRITVRQNTVALVERMPMQEPIVLESAPTIDTLLDDIAAHLAENPQATAEFDPLLGIPVQAELGDEDSIVVEFFDFDLGHPTD